MAPHIHDTARIKQAARSARVSAKGLEDAAAQSLPRAQVQSVSQEAATLEREFSWKFDWAVRDVMVPSIPDMAAFLESVYELENVTRTALRHLSGAMKSFADGLEEIAKDAGKTDATEEARFAP